MHEPRTPRSATLLLVEPESLMRSTVASATRTLELAQVQEVSSLAAADRLLRDRQFQLLLLALDDEQAGLRLLNNLRSGRYRGDKSIPVAVLTHTCDGGMVEELKALQVRKIVLKPFRARTLLDTITTLVSEVNARAVAAIEERA